MRRRKKGRWMNWCEMVFAFHQRPTATRGTDGHARKRIPCASASATGVLSKVAQRIRPITCADISVLLRKRPQVSDRRIIAAPIADASQPETDGINIRIGGLVGCLSQSNGFVPSSEANDLTGPGDGTYVLPFLP